MKFLRHKFAPMYFVGICLSIALFTTIFIIRKQPFFSIFSYELQDSYISVYPVWIWLTVFILICQPLIFIIQWVLRWKNSLWNFSHIAISLLCIPVLLQVQYILNFHIALVAKLILVSDDSWTVNPKTPKQPEIMPYGNIIRWLENNGTHLIISTLILLVIINVILLIRRLKRN